MDWRKSKKFLAIEKITLENCINGTGAMEKIKSILPNSSAGIKKTHVAGPNAPLGYGKYANKTMLEIKRDDPSYFSWMFNNVEKFKKQAKLLGLSPA
jgi:hypothetical protein